MKKTFIGLLGVSILCGAEFNAQMSDYIEELKLQAKSDNANFVDFNAKRGEIIFSTKNIGKNGQNISCQSCHGVDLGKEHSNIFTNKIIAPLSPRANPVRLSDVKEVKKWLRRNFKDVYLREGSALEKGDVLYYLINQ